VAIQGLHWSNQQEEQCLIQDLVLKHSNSKEVKSVMGLMQESKIVPMHFCSLVITGKVYSLFVISHLACNLLCKTFKSFKF
jgi:hypothetical protein